MRFQEEAARWRRGRGGLSEPAPVGVEELAGWLAGRLPDGWFTGPPEITVDRDEISVVGTLTEPELGAQAGAGEAAQAAAGRITRFREDTRAQRMEIADEIRRRFGRPVAWGAAAGDNRQVFTSLSVPVMTRLRQPERMVLDTLIDAGVARSRSDALGWCVRLVASNSEQWLVDLRDALQGVEQVRSQGPVS
jgi:hypothetical protein